MADFNSNFNTRADGELSANISIGGTGNSSGDPLVVAQGDTVSFTHTFHDGVGSPTFDVEPLNSAVWSPSGSSTVPHLGSITRTVIVSATLGTTTLEVAASGYPSATIYFNIVSGVDNTPDSMTLSSITQANPSTNYESNTLVVNGINTAVDVTTSGIGYASVNGGTYSQGNLSVSDGGTVQFRLLSDSSFGGSVSSSVTIGTYSSSWSVTNKTDPGSGEIIPFPITSGTIGLSDIIAFFGGTNNLSAYLKGGSYVPNISENSSIPTSTPLGVSNFLGSATSLFFSTAPESKYDGLNTTGSGGTASVQWTKGVDWDVGFGDIRDVVEMRYTLTQTSGSGVTLSSNSVSFTTGNTFATVSKTVGSNTEETLQGYITIEVRHPNYAGVVLTDTATYLLNIYGP